MYTEISEVFLSTAPNENKSPMEKSPIGVYKYRKLQGTFPVIFLSFANIKAAKYEDMEYKITEVISKLYEENGYLLEGSLLSNNERNYYENIQPGIEETRRGHTCKCPYTD